MSNSIHIRSSSSSCRLNWVELHCSRSGSRSIERWEFLTSETCDTRIIWRLANIIYDYLSLIRHVRRGGLYWGEKEHEQYRSSIELVFQFSSFCVSGFSDIRHDRPTSVVVPRERASGAKQHGSETERKTRREMIFYVFASLLYSPSFEHLFLRFHNIRR